MTILIFKLNQTVYKKIHLTDEFLLAANPILYEQKLSLKKKKRKRQDGVLANWFLDNNVLLFFSVLSKAIFLG